MSACETSSVVSSIAPSIPWVRGSGPSAATSSSLIPGGEERLNPPSPSGMPERGVAGVGQLPRALDEALQHLLDRPRDATASTASLTARSVGLSSSAMR